MPASAGTAYVDFQADMSTLQKQVGAAVAPLTSKFGKLGAAATIGLGGIAVGAVAAGKALYDIGVAFDEASDTIQIKTGATGKQLDKLNKQFKGVVATTPTDFKAAADAVGGLNQRLDVTGKPLRRLSRQMLELSRMTGTDLNDNVSSVARAFGDWEVQTRKQGKTLDFFFRASQASGATVSELTQLIVKFGAPLRQFGFTVEEATSMFALFEKTGVNIQTMVPGLKLALSEFLEAGRDPQRALQKTFEGIADGSINAADAIEIFGKRAGADMVEAISQGRFSFEKFTKTLSKGDSTILGTSKRTQDLSEKWLVFKNKVMVALEPLATKVFDRLGESMSKALDILSDPNLSRTEKFDRISDMITDAFSEGVTKAADAAGRIAPKVAVAFVKGFLNAGIWGQLAAGTFLIAKLGKGSGMAALGRKMGSKFGLAFLAGVLGVELGKQIHKIVVGEKLGSGPREEFAAELEGFGLEVENFVGKNKVRVSTAFGDLIFNARTKQIVKARGRLISNLVGDIPGQAIPKLQRLESSSRNIFEGTSRHAVKKSGDMRKGVVRNVNWLDSGVQRGLASIVGSLNRSLNALGVKKLIANISGNLPDSAQDIQGLQQQGQRGLVVRGTGFGDKVRALLEPGEVVINRRAVAAMGGPQRVNEINQRIPRFAQGGIAEPLLGGTSPTLGALGQAGLHKVTAAARRYLKKHAGPMKSWASIDKFARSFGLAISSTFRPGDSDSFHGIPIGGGRARATDYAGPGGGMFKFANRLGKSMGSKLEELIHSPLGWSIDNGNRVAPYAVADHFDHVHVAFQKGGMVQRLAAGGVTKKQAQNIRHNYPRFYRWAKNRGVSPFLSTAAWWNVIQAYGKNQGVSWEKMAQLHPAQGDWHDKWRHGDRYQRGGIAGFQRGGVVPPWVHGSGTLTANQLASLAKYVHAKHPGLMSQIAQAESGGSPTAMGGAGDKGLWQIIPSTASAFGVNYGKLFDPLANARGMKKILDGQGLSAWSTYNSGAYRSETKGVPSALGGAGGGGTAAAPEFHLSEKQRKRLKKALDKIKKMGLGWVPGVNSLTNDVAKYLELADRASSLGEAVQGGDEGHWLHKQLTALFKLRNKLIRAHEIVVAARDKITEQLQAARGALRKLQKVVNPSKAQKVRMKFLQGRIPALEAQRSVLNTKRGDVLTSLEEVQGPISAASGNAMKILPALPAVGVFGGSIFDTQMRLKELGGDTTATDGSSEEAGLLRQLLREMTERFHISEGALGVFQNTPFAGTFHQGGVVPGPSGAERLILAQGGEVVSPEGSRLRVVIEDNRVRVFENDIERVVEQTTRRMARGGNRPLSSRGGG